MRWIIVKSSIIAVMFAIYGILNKTCNVVVTNEMAINQLNGKNDAFALMTLWNNCRSYFIPALLLIAIVMFIPEIKKIFMKIRGVLKNEENN